MINVSLNISIYIFVLSILSPVPEDMLLVGSFQVTPYRKSSEFPFAVQVQAPVTPGNKCSANATEC